MCRLASQDCIRAPVLLHLSSRRSGAVLTSDKVQAQSVADATTQHPSQPNDAPLCCAAASVLSFCMLWALLPKPQPLLQSNLTCGNRHIGPEQLRHDFRLQQDGGDQLSFTLLLAEVTYQLLWISVAAGPS